MSWVHTLSIALLLAAAVPQLSLAAPQGNFAQTAAPIGNPQQTTLVYSFDPPRLQPTAAGTRVAVADCLSDGVPRAPALPVRGVTIAIPEGYRPRTVRISPGRTRLITLDHPVAPAEDAVPLSSPPDRQGRSYRDEKLYARTTPYPDYDAGEQRRQRRDRLHGDGLLTITLHPVQYIPARNQLLAHGELTVMIDWEPIPSSEQNTGWRPRRKRPRAEADAVAAGSPLLSRAARSVPAPGSPSRAASAATLTRPLSPPDCFEHVIIAPSNYIAGTPAPWNLEALSAARRRAGLNSTQVSIEWIGANYAGRDTAERMRAFIRDAYDNWSTRFILLVGTPAQVPTRKLYCSFSAGTDLIPADGLYFGCLDGSFDRDGDSVFGEIGDGETGWDIDLVAEVFVGRFPAATTADVANMVRKTLAYEALPASALGRISHIGEKLGFGGETEYATGSMEQIRLGASTGGFTSIGFRSSYMQDQLDATDTLYDSPTYLWPASAMLSRLNQNFHVFNHLGHGAAQLGFKIDLSKAANRTAIASLTNALPSFIYSQACYIGAFDTANCLAQLFSTSRGGPFAAVMNSRYGWGYRENIDGPSQLFNRKFWDAAFDGTAYHLGAINARSRENLRPYISMYSGNVFRWIYYELTLFGDPATPFAAPLLNIVPTLSPTGLQRNYTPDELLTVQAAIGPASLINGTTPRIVWRTSSDAAGVYRTNALLHESHLTYAATLPPQPLGTRLTYTLHAETLAGLTVRWPAAGEQHTAITAALNLSITASPSPQGETTPPYGSYSIASGNVVQASAPARVILADGISQACLGSSGTGSAPDTITPTNTFVMLADSQITWLWTDAYLFRQTSNIPVLPGTAQWYRSDEYARTQTAPGSLLHGSVPYRFIGWWLNGNRQPSPHARASNPLVDLTMTAPMTAEARYIPAAADANANGIADWWEYLFFGALDQYDLIDDSDGDGFTLEEEFGDYTDPTNPMSFPSPPSIRHTRLAATQAAPPPYAVQATITDTHSVAQALLRWRRNAEPWTTQTLTTNAAGLYAGTLPAPATFGDQIVYQIEASDPGGRTALAGPYTLTLVYPQATLGPVPSLATFVARHVPADVALVLTNSGNADLHWSLHPAIFETVTDETPHVWTLNAYKQSWTHSSRRFTSSPLALLGAPKSIGGASSPAVHAGLRSPSLVPAPGAKLTFSYWIASEIDTTVAGHAYDGMIVEVTTNAGLTYQQLPGPYTHRLTAWTYSPWKQDTPCFAGNGSEGWRKATFDLAAYAGTPIQLRFVMGGDNNTDGEGVYLDDIEIATLSQSHWPDWLVPARTNGTLAFPAADALPLQVQVGANTPRRLLQRIVLVSDDPVAPRQSTDLIVDIRAIPWIGTPAARQSSTNGEGFVTIAVPVAESDGEELSLSLRYATEAGQPWSVPLLFSPAAALGTPSLAATTGTLRQIQTRSGAQAATNLVTVQWNTPATLPGLPSVVPSMRVQLCVSNAWFGAPPTESPPFMVDNQPPSAPTALQSTTHTLATWSCGTIFTATWNAASDGPGIGGIRYRARLSAGSDDTLADAPRTTGCTASQAAAEGSNLWFAVQALDAFGNGSAITRTGRYFIDLTPPDSSQAAVQVTRSLYGDYVVGTQVATRWNGFADSLSGLNGYQIFIQTPGALAPYTSTVQTQALVQITVLNATNCIWVSAVDKAGNSSPRVGANVLVLNPQSDWDGDGYSAYAEELAGTDAADRHSVLRLGTMASTQPGGGVAICWMGLAGRTYRLLYSPSLSPFPRWTPLGGKRGFPGQGKLIIYQPDPRAPSGFYKLAIY
jgi:hypothetical protein